MQEAILTIALLFQKFDSSLVDTNYEITIKEDLTLKPRDLFIHAKMRPHVSPLMLASSLYHHPTIDPESQSTGISSLFSKVGSEPMVVYFGSSTGTCRGLAEQFAISAARKGFFCAVKVLDEATANIPTDRPIVIITSTQYEGQAPGT